GLCIAMIVFALAESIWAPSFMPMVNDIAPEDLRGRYNALIATVDGAGRVVAPLVAGFLLEAGWGDGLMILLATGCVLLTPIIHQIERRIPPRANVIGEGTTEPI
ncbi:MAG: MFS transporter, partial [Actinomycetota bacterium]|nr:MFS transporter [Actinomycetota bacterium]